MANKVTNQKIREELRKYNCRRVYGYATLSSKVMEDIKYDARNPKTAWFEKRMLITNIKVYDENLNETNVEHAWLKEDVFQNNPEKNSLQLLLDLKKDGVKTIYFSANVQMYYKGNHRDKASRKRVRVEDFGFNAVEILSEQEFYDVLKIKPEPKKNSAKIKPLASSRLKKIDYVIKDYNALVERKLSTRDERKLNLLLEKIYKEIKKDSRIKEYVKETKIKTEIRAALREIRIKAHYEKILQESEEI